VFLYKAQTVTTDESAGIAPPSYLRTLMESTGQTGPGAGAAGNMGERMKTDAKSMQGAKDAEADPNKATATTRTGWVPRGDVAAAAMASVGKGATGGAGGGLGSTGSTAPAASGNPAKDAPAAGTVRPVVPRTEFSVMLVWEEPVTPRDRDATAK
jgi:hypothetical protein